MSGARPRGGKVGVCRADFDPHDVVMAGSFVLEESVLVDAELADDHVTVDAPAGKEINSVKTPLGTIIFHMPHKNSTSP